MSNLHENTISKSAILRKIDLLGRLFMCRPMGVKMARYIGMNYQEIAQQFNSYLEVYVDDYHSSSVELEIRLKDSTLTCKFKNNICTESYLFVDKI